MHNPHLAPFTWLYRGVIFARNAAYDLRLTPVHRVDAPVIAIGNVTTGGTGKTPCAAHVLQVLLAAGRKPALVSRGYGRRSSGLMLVSDGRSLCASAADSGDEAWMLARRFPSVIVAVAERRVDAARAALDHGADCIVADDAFQHRALGRDLNIAITGDELLSSTHALLPRGQGREPLHALSRADVIISTCANEAEARRRAAVWSIAPVIFADVTAVDLIDGRTNAVTDLESLQDHGVMVFTGIANPNRVSTTLRNAGARVVASRQFRDHHWFTAHELRDVVASAQSAGAELVTTEKDFARLSAMPESSLIFEQVKLSILRVAFVLRHGSAEFDSHILRQLR